MFANAPCRPTIAVRDTEQAKAFYGGTLGLALVDENPAGMTYACGAGTYLEVYPSAFAGTARNTVAGFEVDDLETMMAELRSRGITFEEYESPRTVNGVAQLGPSRGAWFKDPDGNTFALVQRGHPGSGES